MCGNTRILIVEVISSLSSSYPETPMPNSSSQSTSENRQLVMFYGRELKRQISQPVSRLSLEIQLCHTGWSLAVLRQAKQKTYAVAGELMCFPQCQWTCCSWSRPPRCLPLVNKCARLWIDFTVPTFDIQRHGHTILRERLRLPGDLGLPVSAHIYSQVDIRVPI